MTCDVCNAPISGNEGKRIPPVEFRTLLEHGFGVDESNIEMLTAGGMMTRDQAIAALKAQYREMTTDWLLCPKCDAKASAALAAAKELKPASAGKSSRIKDDGKAKTGCLVLLVVPTLMYLTWIIFNRPR